SLSSVYTDISDMLTPAPAADQRFVDGDSPDVAIVIDGQPVASDSAKLRQRGREKDAREETIRPVSAQVCTIDTELIKRLEAGGWEQDPDVLDTWCSSWLWPFAT